MLRPISSILRSLYMASELASEDYVDERVDGRGRAVYLDSRVSVSALRRDETHLWLGDNQQEEQHRRFLNAVEVF